jgi:isopentenyl diphosphate isomerase/L-lactate dehydrogenase-like FMN-dependent dehydrogenase
VRRSVWRRRRALARARRRPYVYGLALAGEAGVREVVANFLADFDLTMGLAGCRSVSEISPETLVPAPP